MGLLSEKWSSQLLMQLMQLCKRSLKKFRTSTGFELTHDLAIWVQFSNQLSYEAAMILGSGQLCVHMFPWKRWNVTKVNKWNKSYMRTAEMKSSEAWSSQLMYFIYICCISCLSREHREAVSLNQKRYMNSCVRLSLLRSTSLCVRHGLTLVSNVCATASTDILVLGPQRTQPITRSVYQFSFHLD